MPGYTKEQLEAKGASASSYILCSNCDLYWHKRVFEKHLRPSSKEREIESDHPVWDSLLDFAIPFEFTIPPGPRARRAAAKRSAEAGAAPTPEAGHPVEDAARRGALKDRYAALLEHRVKLDEEIAQAARGLALAETTAAVREPDVASSGSAAPAQGARFHRSLPPGMTAWVSAEDVANAVGCSNSKAHEYLRAAAGRSVGTGRLLRVPVGIWEAWARENLVDGRRPERRASDPAIPWTNVAAGGSRYRRRDLAPVPRVESKLPLIPTLSPKKR